MSLFVSLLGPIAMFISVAEDVADCDHAKIQGIWRIVSIAYGGKADNHDIDKYTVMFDGNTMSIRKHAGDTGRTVDEVFVKFELGREECSRRITFGCGMASTISRMATCAFATRSTMTCQRR